MADDAVHYCSICRKPAYSAHLFVVRSKLNGDQELYDVGCAQCGEYRISADGESAMGRQSDTHRSTLLKLIASANERGNRFCINDGREVAISTIATPGGTPRIPTSPPFQTPAPRLTE